MIDLNEVVKVWRAADALILGHLVADATDDDGQARRGPVSTDGVRLHTAVTEVYRRIIPALVAELETSRVVLQHTKAGLDTAGKLAETRTAQLAQARQELTSLRHPRSWQYESEIPDGVLLVQDDRGSVWVRVGVQDWRCIVTGDLLDTASLSAAGITEIRLPR